MSYYYGQPSTASASSSPNTPSPSNLDISCIIDAVAGKGGLYLGNITAATNNELLASCGIRAMLTSAMEATFTPDLTVTPSYLKIPALDYPSYKLDIYFQQAADFINDNLASTNVLVHCMAGVSRSVSFVIAYLLKYRGMEFDMALDYVRFRRAVVNPNCGFIDQLKKYEKEIKKSAKDLQKRRKKMEKMLKNHHPALNEENASLYETQRSLAKSQIDDRKGLSKPKNNTSITEQSHSKLNSPNEATASKPQDQKELYFSQANTRFMAPFASSLSPGRPSAATQPPQTSPTNPVMAGQNEQALQAYQAQQFQQAQLQAQHQMAIQQQIASQQLIASQTQLPLGPSAPSQAASTASNMSSVPSRSLQPQPSQVPASQTMLSNPNNSKPVSPVPSSVPPTASQPLIPSQNQIASQTQIPSQSQLPSPTPSQPLPSQPQFPAYNPQQQASYNPYAAYYSQFYAPQGQPPAQLPQSSQQLAQNMLNAYLAQGQYPQNGKQATQFQAPQQPAQQGAHQQQAYIYAQQQQQYNQLKAQQQANTAYNKSLQEFYGSQRNATQQAPSTAAMTARAYGQNAGSYPRYNGGYGFY